MLAVVQSASRWCHPTSHLVLCCPLFPLPSVFSGIKAFSSESAVHVRWPKNCWCLLVIWRSTLHLKDNSGLYAPWMLKKYFSLWLFAFYIYVFFKLLFLTMVIFKHTQSQSEYSDECISVSINQLHPLSYVDFCLSKFQICSEFNLRLFYCGSSQYLWLFSEGN